jgi:hypothetical protein
MLGKDSVAEIEGGVTFYGNLFGIDALFKIVIAPALQDEGLHRGEEFKSMFIRGG